MEYLGSYGEKLYDSYCGEVVGWGYKIVKRCGTEIWSELDDYGEKVCTHGYYPPSWYLITKKLTIEEATKKYGGVTNIKVGPRGGFKNVTYGKTTFCSRNLDPR